jgi:hypothetical protein
MNDLIVKGRQPIYPTIAPGDDGFYDTATGTACKINGVFTKP